MRTIKTVYVRRIVRRFNTIRDLCIESIRHELELSVRRNERDSAVVLEAIQAHTLMELDILQLHRLDPILTTQINLKKYK